MLHGEGDVKDHVQAGKQGLSLETGFARDFWGPSCFLVTHSETALRPMLNDEEEGRVGSC